MLELNNVYQIKCNDDGLCLVTMTTTVGVKLFGKLRSPITYKKYFEIDGNETFIDFFERKGENINEQKE